MLPPLRDGQCQVLLPVVYGAANMDFWITEKGTKAELAWYGPRCSRFRRVKRRSWWTPGPSGTRVKSWTRCVDRGAVAFAADTDSFTFRPRGRRVDAPRRIPPEGRRPWSRRGVLETGLSPFPAGTTLGTKAFMAVFKRPGELATRYPGVNPEFRRYFTDIFP